MKLRVRENSIRFPLKRSEVVQLTEMGFLENRIEFEDLVWATREKTSVLISKIASTFSGGPIQAVIPGSSLKDWPRLTEVRLNQ